MRTLFDPVCPRCGALTRDGALCIACWRQLIVRVWTQQPGVPEVRG